MTEKFDKSQKICYNIEWLQNGNKNYKRVTKRGFIIRLTKIRLVSVVMAIFFALGSSLTVYADDTYAKKAADASVNTTLESSALHSMPNELSDEFEISVSNIGAKTASLSWSDNGGDISYCVIRYNEDTLKQERYAVTNDTFIEMTNLTPNTQYKFIIATALSNRYLGAIGFTTGELVASVEIADVASSFVKFTIKDIEKGAYVELYKGDSEDDLKLLATVEDIEYIDRDVVEGKSYYYKAVVKTASGAVVENEVIKVTTPVKMGLPSVSGSIKTYAHYTAVTARSTAQYKLLNSSECYTDEETGIRMVDDCYCVALGSYYGSKIGTKYRIEFSTGKSIKVILCDQKSNRHTDSNNQYAVRNKDIIEFYVQKNKIPKSVRGNYGNLSQFEGDIVSIEKYV